VYWVHEDSDADAILAVDEDGNVLSEQELPGSVDDLEDIAVVEPGHDDHLAVELNSTLCQARKLVDDVGHARQRFVAAVGAAAQHLDRRAAVGERLGRVADHDVEHAVLVDVADVEAARVSGGAAARQLLEREPTLVVGLDGRFLSGGEHAQDDARA